MASRSKNLLYHPSGLSGYKSALGQEQMFAQWAPGNQPDADAELVNDMALLACCLTNVSPHPWAVQDWAPPNE